ncbi:GGDEF domain-containing protein [SCandidatus Aminicenantes bacterium Aminicenantia_JdfR_composite]|nr:GGDEF domain-containing protein [SCandidatus Aminicenantes bacterium Aminicenantia_JdfR_composite]
MDKIDFLKEEKEPVRKVKVKKVKVRNFREIDRQLDELSRIYIGKSIFKREKKWRLSDKRKIEFEKELNKEIERAKRYKEKLIVSALDIDDFKRINNEWGIKGGDFVLKTISETIEKNKRPYDLLFRYKNDEFILILINVKEKQGVRIIKRIQNAINNKKIIFNNSEKNITISAGIFAFNGKDEVNAFELVKFAEKALQKAKKFGRNQVTLY